MFGAALAVAGRAAAAPEAAPGPDAVIYPTKPVRLIVTFPPGGTPDIYGRVMASELSTLWSQSVVVENKTGASGVIGTDYVAKSPPDGYTLLFGADAPITIAPALTRHLPYDPVRDFVPIVNVAEGAFTLMVHPSVPATRLPELLALARARPGVLSYASSGNGSQQHLAMEMIQARTGVQLVHIPYKGFGQALGDVIAGHVPMLFGGATASISIAASGKLRPIAVTSRARVDALPGVPAVAEDLPGFEILAWYGFLAPAGTPRATVRKIHDDVVHLISQPAFKERLARDGIWAVGNTPEAFSAQIAADLKSWADLIRRAGVQGD
jgi:tripartite-type tricarboxylate transporter receptor subunit TctC